MTHNIAVIGGDGIGPEVIAEALKVVRAAGVDIDTTDFDLGGARYLRDGEILSDEVLDELRGFDAILLGAVGTPEVPPGRDRAGPAAEDALRARPLHQPAAVPRYGAGRRHAARLRRDPREHRGPVRRRGWRSCARARRTRSPPRARSTPAIGVERCVRYAFELAGEPPAQAPHPGAQDQRAHLRRRPVGAHVRRGRRRVPRRRPPPTTTSTRPASTSCRTRSATT